MAGSQPRVTKGLGRPREDPGGGRNHTSGGIRACRHQAGAPRGRRALRPPDQTVEPEDAALPVRGAIRIYIIDLEKSLEGIEEALRRSSAISGAAAGRSCSSAPRSRRRKSSRSTRTAWAMPFVNHRWLGGMLTNFTTISRRLPPPRVAGDGIVGRDGQPAEEGSHPSPARAREARTEPGRDPSARAPPGRGLRRDTKKEQIAVTEARKLDIPVIAIVDTNCDPDEVDFVIPGNDDAIRAVSLVTRVIADATRRGIRHGEGRGDREVGLAAAFRRAAPVHDRSPRASGRGCASPEDARAIAASTVFEPDLPSPEPEVVVEPDDPACRRRAGDTARRAPDDRYLGRPGEEAPRPHWRGDDGLQACPPGDRGDIDKAIELLRERGLARPRSAPAAPRTRVSSTAISTSTTRWACSSK